MPLTSEQAREIGKLGGRKNGKQAILRRLELQQRDLMEKAIYKKTASLIRAGMIPALGQHFVYKINKSKDNRDKKYQLVKKPEEIAHALDMIDVGGVDENGIYYFISVREPDYKAIDMLLNRAYGKPKESISVSGEIQFSLKNLLDMRSDIKAQAIDITDKLPIKNDIDVSP